MISLIFIIGCERRVVNVNQPNDDDSISIISIELINENYNEFEHLELDDIVPLQEAIANYPYTSTETAYRFSGVMSFQIEGNFTGSGNNEILVFYEDILWNSITALFCFVLDYHGEKIENAFYIPYVTLRYRENDLARSGIVEAEALGREIMWDDQLIGRVGDFNENGIEELSLYYLTGMNISPVFFEFDGSEFSEILDIGVVDIGYILNVDPVEKIISISIESSSNDSPILSVYNNSYRWDAEARRCILIFSETKRYRWDWNTREYEIIENDL